ncbi:MAG: MYXO-CTERM sorting domain-containing protein [Sandaracinaceae bacterium]|nr:MYXO-CTERM sorting domain-containing protein [Sandaracinaceae bacterium]
MARSFFFALALAPSIALAQPMLINDLGGVRGYGTQCLSPNDDGSSAAIDLTTAFPGGLEFFGRRHMTAFVNTNGNITFNGGLSDYTPDPFPVANRPMIAPYWSDVDIRAPGGFCGPGGSGSGACGDPPSNGVWWNLSPGRMVVTWDQVGYFACTTSLRMTFQLILQEARYCGITGDFDVEFRYTQCEWETGDIEGENGFGPTGAQVGFDAGNLMDFVQIMGSRMPGISRVVCDGSNVGEPGVWRFRIRRGIVECPDAGEPCTVDGAIGVCAEGRTQCRGAAIECVPIVEPAGERCDAFDNDCDGMVDEEDAGPLCSGSQVCDRGRCIERCFEGGCASGETCDNTTGVCYEDACRDVPCDAGQRCIGGTCRDVCDGVVCPAAQSCVAGRCANLCETVTCGPCELCQLGDCVTRCEVDGCPPGQACEETGECVAEDCLGVRCGPGRVCRAGRCSDACEGVVCPTGEVCNRGQCGRPAPLPDGGPVEVDGGPMPVDAGGQTDAGGGEVDGGVRMDGGGGPPMAGGCGCKVGGESRGGGWAFALFGVAALSLWRRRRVARAGGALAVVGLALAIAGCDTQTIVVDECGDGNVLIPELCDDGNTMDGDGCAADCSAVETGWRCIGSPSVCMENTDPVCNNRAIEVGEQCDEGGEAADCDDDCTFVMCGDGNVNETAGEGCDDGNTASGDGCTNRCEVEPSTCGPGPCDDGETCTTCAGDCADTPLCINCPDADMDGEEDSACGGTDCNDEDPNVNTAATEIPCNRVDEDCSPATRDAVDADMDGSSCNFDCDDANNLVSPLLVELCNDSLNNDCNEATPDVGDFDGDGSICTEDCDDYRATTCPTCPELCNNTLDDDCDPATPDLFDADGDMSNCNVDCNDDNAMVRPGATELCANDTDDDCNPSTLDRFDRDRDGDACDTDCDDMDPLRASSRREVCGNGRDDDCDSGTPEVVGDYDMDGSPCTVDCNDGDMSIVPDSAGRCGPRTMYTQDFETDDGGWVASGTASSWAYGTPAATFITGAASGTHAWVTNPTGEYNTNELSYLTSPPFDFSAVFTDPVLSFSHIYETEGCCDEGWVEVSVNGGMTWRKVGASGQGSNWYNDATNQWWDGTSGAAGAWRTASILLSNTAGFADVRVRFVFSSDFSGEEDGFGVDDISLDNHLLDLAVESFTLPAEMCAGSRPIVARIRNNSGFAMPSYQIAYTLDGGAPVTQTISTPIGANAAVDHTFTTPANLTAGMHTIVVTATVAGDGTPGNDSRTVMVSSIPTIAITAGSPYVEGFESGPAGWTTSGTRSSWEHGAPAATFINAAASGTNAWVTNLTGLYDFGETSYLTSPCFDMSSLSANPTISFSHIFRSEAGFDYGWLEVQQADGTWLKLGGQLTGGTNWYGTNDRWEGCSDAASMCMGAGAWRTASHPIFSAPGRSGVRLRFYFRSDFSDEYEGFGVDDVRIMP